MRGVQNNHNHSSNSETVDGVSDRSEELQSNRLRDETGLHLETTCVHFTEVSNVAPLMISGKKQDAPHEGSRTRCPSTRLLHVGATDRRPGHEGRVGKRLERHPEAPAAHLQYKPSQEDAASAGPQEEWRCTYLSSSLREPM